MGFSGWAYDVGWNTDKISLIGFRRFPDEEILCHYPWECAEFYSYQSQSIFMKISWVRKSSETECKLKKNTKLLMIFSILALFKSELYVSHQPNKNY